MYACIRACRGVLIALKRLLRQLLALPRVPKRLFEQPQVQVRRGPLTKVRHRMNHQMCSPRHGVAFYSWHKV